MALNLDQIRSLAERVAGSHGLDIVDIEYQGGGGKYRTLRVYIEKNAEERARLVALAAAREPRHATLEDVEDEEFADEEVGEEADDRAAVGSGGDEEDAQADADEGDIENDEDDDGDDEEDEDDEDDAAYDHDAFLASLPSVANLEHLSGVTHGDCEQFSRDFGTVLDVEELVPGTEYLLEVSSPGLDRRLSKVEDFRRFTGSLVKVQTFEPVAGNRHWQGRLASMEEAVLRLVPAGEKKSKKGKKTAAAKQEAVEIALSNVEKATLVPEF